MSQKKDKRKIIFFRESIFKVTELIFNDPNKVFHLRMLAEITGFSTTAIDDAIEELKNFDIIKIVHSNLTKNVKANLNSEAYRFYKLIFNLYRLKRYSIIDNLIEIFQNPEAIVLFGSFAKGEDIEQSDIDILVISKNEPNENLSDFVNIIEKELKRKSDLHILPSLERSSVEFKNAVANGIVLHGYLKVL